MINKSIKSKQADLEGVIFSFDLHLQMLNSVAAAVISDK